MSDEDTPSDDHVDKNRSMQVDDNLRRVYNDILEEDVPERFKELLDRLKEQETQTQHRTSVRKNNGEDDE